MKVPIAGPLHRKTSDPDAPHLKPPTLRDPGHLSTHLRVLADDHSRLIAVVSGFCPSAPELQAATRKKRCQRKQFRLATQQPSGANTDPF